MNLGGLRQGDVLICALTEHTAAQRTVCPLEVQRLQDQGVKVYTQESLHAKLYLFGNIVAVGSPNLTSHSLNALDEACLLTDNPCVVEDVRAWFRNHRGQLVTPDLLARCVEAYSKSSAPAPPQTVADQLSRPIHPGDFYGPQHPLWVVGVTPTTFPRSEARQREEGERRAEEVLSNPAAYEVASIRWTWKPSTVGGDIIVQLMKQRKQWCIYPHARVLGVTPVAHGERSKETVCYVHIEKLRERGDAPLSLSWEVFREECHREGLYLPATPDDLEELPIVSWNQKLLVLRLTTPED